MVFVMFFPNVEVLTVVDKKNKPQFANLLLGIPKLNLDSDSLGCGGIIQVEGNYRKLA